MKQVGLIKTGMAAPSVVVPSGLVGKIEFLGRHANHMPLVKGIDKVLNWGGSAAKIGVGLMLSGVLIKKLIDSIKNDSNKKRIIEDLALNDPVLKEVEKSTLLEWYATLCHYAPTLCTDKQTVGEVLRNFARFGKIDINTLKMLADTEKSISSARENDTNFVDLTKFVG